MKNKNIINLFKKQQDYLRRPPRLEGKVQNKGIKPKKK